MLFVPHAINAPDDVINCSKDSQKHETLSIQIQIDYRGEIQRPTLREVIFYAGVPWLPKLDLRWYLVVIDHKKNF